MATTLERLIDSAVDRIRDRLPGDRVLRVEPDVRGETVCVWATIANEVAGQPDRSFFLENVVATIERALSGLQGARVRVRFLSEGASTSVSKVVAGSVPGVMGGRPVFKGTRIPVELVAELLRQGTTEAELLAAYPTLDLEKIEYARAQRLTA